MISRFAPSTTGDAHPGTLLSALLVWLDARAVNGRAILRLEDLERARNAADGVQRLTNALDWLGLTFDDTVVQSSRARAHEQALDTLAAAGRLYACSCSRKMREGGRRAPDGSWAYDNRCRQHVVSAHDWRKNEHALRVRLNDDEVFPIDDGGLTLAQTPALAMGDPLVRRRDGSVTYQLAVVVDDADAGVTHVVRGHDLAPSTATQVMLQHLLGLPTPRYRHHLLLLEETRGDKLAKLHGSVGYATMSQFSDGKTFCGQLAFAVGLAPTAAPTAPADLVARFSWDNVRREDLVARWNSDHVSYGPA